MLETDALRQSIRHGDGAWDAQLRAAFEQLSQAEQRRGGLDPWNGSRPTRPSTKP
jgi:DNA-binding GntR family transcriptional regulator